jgi:autotransporter-associated beta strand protein
MEQVRKSESAAASNARVTRRFSAGGQRGSIPLLPPGLRAWVTCMLLLAGMASGATRTWTGAGGTDYWSSSANWGGIPPAAGDDLVFAGSTRLTPYNDITPGTAFNSITFNPGSGPFTVGGNAIALTGGAAAIANNATGGVMVLNLPITFNAAPTISQAAGGMLDLGGPLNAGAYNTTCDGPGNLDISGALSGTGGLIKNGAGALKLNGANTYSGPTHIAAGVLIVNNASALGSAAAGTTVASGAALDLKGVDYTGSEPLTLNGTGAGGGALINSAAAPAAFAGLITLGSNASIIGESGTIAITHAGTITGSGYDLTLGGSAGGTLKSILGTGSGSLVKQGNGAWVLTGANSYAGTTTVGAGALVPLNPSALGGTTAGTTVSAGATLDLHGVYYSNPEPLTLNGLGPGNIGALTNDSAVAASYAGLITLGSSSSIKCGAGPIFLTHSGTITGAGHSLTLGGNFSGDLASQLGTGSGALTKEDAGAWTLGGSNTYTGPTTISAGTLRLGAAGAIPDGSAVTANGTLEMNGFSETIGSLAGTGFVDNNAGTGIFTLTTGGTNVQTTFSGVIKNTTQTVALTKNGTAYMLLTGDNTYAGVTTVNGGVLSVGNNGTTGALPGDCVVASGAAVRFARSDAQTYSGDISGAGQVMKINAGALTLTGTNTYTGATLITGGAFIIGSGGAYGSVTGTLILAGGGGGSIVFNRSDNLTYSGQITGTDATGSVVKNGPNVLTLSGTNDYTGATVVNSGTLKLGDPDALGSTAGGTSVAYGAALDLGGVNYTNAEPLTLNGTGISNGGALMNSDVNQAAFAGPITLGSAASIVGGPTSGIDVANTGSVSGGYPLTLDGSQGGFFAGTLSGGALIKQGAGGWTLTGADPLALASLTLSNGTLYLGSGLTHNVSTALSLTGGTLDFGSSTLRFSGSSADFSALAGLTAGTGTLEFSGTTGMQSYTPNVSENPGITHTGAGTLRLNAFLACQSFSQTAGILDFNGYDLTTVNGGNFSITNGAPTTVAGLDGAIITVAGTAALAGASSGSRLDLSPTGTWTMAVTGALTGSFLTLGNSQATVHAGACGNCSANAGNSNWTFSTSWDGGGGDHKWSTPANWGGDAVPSAAEDVAFDGLSNDYAVLDMDGAVKSITFSGGYTADFSFSTHTLSVTGGTADFSTGGTITAGTGTLAFTGTGAQTFIPKAGAVFPNIHQNGNAGATTVTGAALTAGNLTLGLGAFNLGASMTHTFKGISGAGALDFGSSDLNAQGDVNFGSATLTAAAGRTLAFTGTTAQNFTPNASETGLTLIQNGSGGTTLLAAIASTPALTIASGTLRLGAGLVHTVATSLTVTGGGLDFGSSTLKVQAASVDLHLLSALTPGAGTLQFARASAQTFVPHASLPLPRVEQFGTGVTTVTTNPIVTADILMIWNGAFQLGTGLNHVVGGVNGSGGVGTLDFGTSSLNVTAGNAYLGNLAGVTTTGSGSLEFSAASGTQNFTTLSGFTNPAIVHSGAGTLRQGGATSFASFHQTAGTLDLNGYDLTTSGNFTLANGTSSSFAGLDGRTLTIGGNASISGASAANKTNLDPANTWFLAVAGTLNANLASLARSNATGSAAAGVCGDCANIAGNANWNFATVWKGAGPNTNWSTALNWGSQTVPTAGENVIFNSTSVKDVLLDTDVEVNSVSVNSGYTGNIDFTTHTLSIRGSADFDGGETVTPGTGTLAFTGTAAQTFRAKSATTFPAVLVNGAVGTTLTGALTAGNLTVASGTLNLGSGFIHSFGSVSGTGSLDFNGSELGARGNVDLSGLTVTAASANILAFTGVGSQAFTPKASMTALKLSKTGSGVTTITGSGFTTPLLTLANGTLQLGAALIHTASDLALTGGSLNMGSARLATSADTVDFRSLTITFPTDSSALEFTGGSAQTFITKIGANVPSIIQNGAGGTTVSINNPITKKLFLVSGTLHLGSSRTFTVSDSLLALGGGLDFGTSTNLVFKGAALDMQPISPLTAGTGTLEFNGTIPQIYTPKASATHPSLKVTGTGGTTILGNGLQTASIQVANGTLHLGANLIHATAGFTGTSGGLDFGSSTLEYSGAGINLALLTTVSRGTGTLRFTGASASLQPHATDTLPDIKQSGTGTTTVITNGLKTGLLAPLSGTFHFGSGLNHSIGSISMGAGPYGSLNFGTSQVHISGNADLGSLAALTPGSGKLYFDAATGTQIFTPKAGGSAHPQVFHTGSGALRLAANNLACAAFTQTAGVLDLNGSDLTTSGAFTVSNGAPTSVANLGGRTLTVGGNAKLTGQKTARLNLDPASAWNISVAGSLEAVHANLKNSIAIGTAGLADSSLDLGGNVNWTFLDTAKPGNVTGFAAQALGGHAVELTWTAPAAADADSVMLRYRTDGVEPQHAGDGILWRSVSAAATVDTATGLPDKTVFHFAAFTRDSSGNYALKNGANADSAATPDVTAPANVPAFTATALTATTASLDWSPSAASDADTVVIRYRADGAYPENETDGTLWKKLSAAAAADTVTGLAQNSVYHFAAFVRDTSGNFSPGAPAARDTVLYQVPVLGSLAIADAAGRTADVDPALAFTWSGADSMRVSLLADTAAAIWTGLRTADSLNVSAGADGTRILTVQFKNVYGSRSLWYRDTTQLDRSGPVMSLNLDSIHSWRNWPNAVSGRATDAIAGADSVWVVRRREADGAYFNGAGWTSVADTARLRADSTFGVAMPNAAMATGYYTFTVSSRDKLGNRSSPLALRVNYQENRAPVAAASTVADSAFQNQPVSWQVEVGEYDAGDSILTVTASVPAWLTLTETQDSAQGGFSVRRGYNLAGKPSQGDVGNATVTLQARDAGGLTVTYSKTFPVIDVNDPPVFAAGQDSTRAKEDSVSRFIPRYTDADSKDPHSLALLQAPAWVRIADSALEFKPGSRDVGPALVRLTVSDGKLLDTLDLKVNVANSNDLPYAFPSANWQAQARWKEDVADSFSVVVVDMDKGDNISLATVLPEWITYQSAIDPVEGINRFFRFAVKPTQADIGVFSFKLRFQDAAGAFSELPFTAQVAAVNDVPAALILGQESHAGAARIALDVTDQDGSAASTRFHYRLISASGDTLRRGICPATLLPLHPLADGDYRLAVSAEDEGGLRQSGFTIADVRISGATTLSLDTARWHMIGYPGRSLSAGALGAGAALTTWDESASDGSPLGRYAAGKPADSLARGKGYWVRVAKPVAVTAPFPELLDRPYIMKLTHGKQGWNQVGNPFPYFVDLSKTGLTFWEWDAARRDLVNAKGILKPWSAYWVQVAKDTVLAIKDQPYFPAATGAGRASGALAKSANAAAAPASDRGFAAEAGWTLQMALRAGPYQDQANFLGIRDVTFGAPAGDAAAPARSGLIPDAPKFGDYIALHFVNPGDASAGYAEDFRVGMGDGEEWWDFTVENSGSGHGHAELSLPGLRNLEALGLHAFLVRKGEAVPVSGDAPVILPMEGRATHYSLVVTPHVDFAARLKGNFSISQNFPNPVQTFTSFRFALPQTWDAAGKREAKGYRLRLNVYDYSGRLAARVADATFKPGSHTLLWKPRALNGGILAKGAYVYRLEVPGFTKSLKMLVK